MQEIRKLILKHSQTFKTIGKLLLLLTLLSIILPLIRTPKDKSNIDKDFEVEKRYDNLVKKYLAPWLPVDSDSPSTRVVVTQRMLAIVEYTHKGACVRVRWYNGKIFFRVVMNLRLRYFYERMEFLLRSLYEIGQDGLYTGNWDAIFNLADGPLISKVFYLIRLVRREEDDKNLTKRGGRQEERRTTRRFIILCQSYFIGHF
jgi:hypothetical protein